MSDAAQPTAAEVRAAAEAVKTALDRHLAAVERRSGEDDPDVYEAFNELAAAAEAYDELLYDRYDEVTPFEIPGAEDALPPYQGPAEPNALSVLIRRDYAVAEPQRLLAQAARVESADDDATVESDRLAGTVPGALGLLFGEFEPDEIASRHKEFGLEEGDSTLWVTAADEPAEPGEWLETPFDQPDAQRVVCRFDVSAVFDDETDDELDDDLDAAASRVGGARRGRAAHTGLDGDLDGDLDTDLDTDLDFDPDEAVSLDEVDGVDDVDDADDADEADDGDDGDDPDDADDVDDADGVEVVERGRGGGAA